MVAVIQVNFYCKGYFQCVKPIIRVDVCPFSLALLTEPHVEHCTSWTFDSSQRIASSLIGPENEQWVVRDDHSTWLRRMIPPVILKGLYRFLRWLPNFVLFLLLVFLTRVTKTALQNGYSCCVIGQPIVSVVRAKRKVERPPVVSTFVKSAPSRLAQSKLHARSVALRRRAPVRFAS